MSDRIHDLLPWYLNGTLEPAEREAFARHLEACGICRKEQAFLEKLQGEIERHGEDFLADHPSPETLLAVLKPSPEMQAVSPERAAETRRHLELCATCAEEASWLEGEAGSATSSRRWWWAAAAAVILVLAFTLPVLFRQPVTSPAGLIRPVLVEPTLRTVEGRTEVRLPYDARSVYVYFPIDLPAEAWPATLEILDSTRRIVYRDRIAADDLTEGRFVFRELDRAACPDGAYTAEVRGAGAGDPPVEYPFRIVSETPP